MCAGVASKTGTHYIVMSPCERSGNSKWSFNRDTGQLVNIEHNLCLDATGISSSDFAKLSECKVTDMQHWEIEHLLE